MEKRKSALVRPSSRSLNGSSLARFLCRLCLDDEDDIELGEMIERNNGRGGEEGRELEKHKKCVLPVRARGINSGGWFARRAWHVGASPPGWALSRRHDWAKLRGPGVLPAVMLARGGRVFAPRGGLPVDEQLTRPFGTACLSKKHGWTSCSGFRRREPELGLLPVLARFGTSRMSLHLSRTVPSDEKKPGKEFNSPHALTPDSAEAPSTLTPTPDERSSPLPPPPE